MQEIGDRIALARRLAFDHGLAFGIDRLGVAHTHVTGGARLGSVLRGACVT